MYSYAQLLIRNALFGLAIFIGISTATLFTLESYVTKQQQAHKEHLTLSASHILQTNDVKSLALLLKKSANYDILVIKNTSDETLYDYQDRSSDELSLSFLKPAVSTVNIEQAVSIQFRLNIDAISRLAVMLIASYLGFTFILIFFAALISKRQYHSLFTAINRHIKEQFSLQETPQKKPITIHIPELEQGLATIRSLLNENEQKSSELKAEAYVDSLTKLPNRNRFIQYFHNQINNDGGIKFGVMVISRCSELQTINKMSGYKEGDNYIDKVANIIKNEVVRYKGAEVFRLNSSDFATVIPNVTLKEAENYAQGLTDNFNDLQQSADLDSVAYSGLAYFTADKPLGELLALTDTAISVAQTQHLNAWYSQSDDDILNNNSASYGNQNWRQEIESVIENQRLNLCIQPIQTNKRTGKMYGEVYARFLSQTKDVLPTASFIAMAEKLDKIVYIDRLVIEQLLKEIVDKNLQGQSFGVNISARSIHDEHFLIWLERRLLREQSLAGNLVFEITELGLQQNVKTSRRFIDMIHRVGGRVTVERFGIGLTSFKFFKDLKPDFIKLDSSYTRDIDEDKNNQYFIRVMVDLAHRLSVSVLAECVETLEEKHALEQLFVDGFQGYHISKPEPI